MARNKSPQDYNRDFDRRGGHSEPQEWDDADWDPDQEAAAGYRARRLLSRSNSGFHRFGDGFGAVRRWLAADRWLKRLAIVVGALAVIFVGCFGALWWRLGTGPINLDIATPWLAAAIEDNIGHGNTVEVGGTQIERAGRIRIAVRIRDIVVRDHDHAIVATAPKAEVKLSGAGLLMGHLRAESLNLVDAELAIRIAPDGTVTVSAGDTAKPLATGVASKKDAGLPPTFPRNGVPPPPFATAPASPDASQAAPQATAQSGILQGLDWLDSLSMTGLDGQNLNEIGLKNGNLIVDDQQRGSKWTFENITLSLRRPSRGGVALSLGEEGARPWSLRATIGPAENGVRSVDIRADKVSTANILLALRVKDLTYTADLPLTGELKGELGRDGVPTFFRGKITVGAGNIIDTDTPDYPMAIDSAEINVEWDSNRRVLVAPFKILSGANRLTLLAHLEPPNGSINDWQLGFSGGSILLGGIDNEPPLVFNRIAIGLRFDTDHKRLLLTQADISNGEIGVAGTGAIDYSGEPRLTLGFAGTPMSASALKRMWPTLVVPELREWVIERIERGTLQRIEIGVNSPTRNLPRKGPPIPDDGLSVNIVASGVAVRPVDGMPVVHDADLKARVTGRTATVSIGQGIADTPAGRKVTISDFVFEVPDMAPKPSPSRTRFRVDGPVPAAAEMLANDRLSDLSATVVDPNTSKGTFSANIQLGLPVKGELTKADTTYAVTADLNGFAADKLVMNQKLEANNLKIVASNQGYQVKGDVKINGQAASLDYRKQAEGDADVRLQATLDDASRARLGFDLSPAVSGSLPIKLSGKIAGGADQTTKLGVEADLTSVKLDNILPGWVKLPGKSGKASFKGGADRAIDALRGHRHRRRWRLDQGLARGGPERRPHERELPDLRAIRRRQGVVEGRAQPGRRGARHDARRRVRRPRFPEVGDLRQFQGRCQEQDEERRFRHRREARRRRRIQRRGDAQRRCQDVAAQRRRQSLHAERQDRPRYAGGGRSARRPCPGCPRGDLSPDQRCRRAPALHRYHQQGLRRPDGGGDGAADVRAYDQGRPDQCTRLHGQGNGSARSRGGGRSQWRAERRVLHRAASGVHPAERRAHDPRRRRQGTDDRRHHRRLDRLSRQPGLHERHLRADVRRQQHLRPDPVVRHLPRRRQQRGIDWRNL
ncbi:hypothetical protein ACVIHC_000804 [Bradyrhizobium diazoefficiens]